MDRNQLLQFLYDYIQKNQYLNRRSRIINGRVSENNSKRSQRIGELKSKFNSFYDNNLKTNQKNIEGKIKKRKERLSKLRRRIFGYRSYIKYRYLIMIVFLLAWVPFVARLLFSLLTFPGSRTPNEVIEFLKITLNSGLALFVVAAIVSVPLRWILKPLGYLLSPLANAFVNLSDSIRSKAAHAKDLSFARRKGITPENIKEVFKYNEIKEEIENNFDDLEKQIRSWQYDESIEQRNELSVLNGMILKKDMKLDYVIYMYEQLYIGAVDNWKEAINDLKSQLKHEELKSEIRIVSQNIRTSNQMLVAMNQNMNHRFSQLDKMVSTQLDRIDARLDGIYEAGYFFYR